MVGAVRRGPYSCARRLIAMGAYRGSSRPAHASHDVDFPDQVCEREKGWKEGLPELYLAMKKAGMSAELHAYGKVGHGFGFWPHVQTPMQQ
jgi:hypothetical protein